MALPEKSRDCVPAWLRRFSKVTCFATLFLIFAGGLVTSTGSGLAVPDWPLSYGTLFPPMVGGIFYEHGHRMIAAGVGFLMLCLTISLGIIEKRKWVRSLGIAALGAVVLQGILGGMTVLFFLPTPVSVAHAMLAQIFFVLTILIAYSLSQERQIRQHHLKPRYDRKFIKLILLFIGLIYVQLVIGAVMRHTGAGLAIPDFPTMGERWIPLFDAPMLRRINDRLFDLNLDPVTFQQTIIHFLHRAGALILLAVIVLLNRVAFRCLRGQKRIMESLFLLDLLFILQVTLGILTVVTAKEPRLTSLHVATGAGVLGLTVLMFLRAAPLSVTRSKQYIL